VGVLKYGTPEKLACQEFELVKEYVVSLKELPAKAYFTISTGYKSVMVYKSLRDTSHKWRLSNCDVMYCNGNRHFQGPLSAFRSFARSGTHKANAADAVANMNRRGAHFTHAGTPPALFAQHATWQIMTE
jgi:hypothetical protein